MTSTANRRDPDGIPQMVSSRRKKSSLFADHHAHLCRLAFWNTWNTSMYMYKMATGSLLGKA